MDKTLQMYIDKLNALNFKDMYEGDFFHDPLTGEAFAPYCPAESPAAPGWRGNRQTAYRPAPGKAYCQTG